MYMITYKEDGTIMSVGSVDPAYNAHPTPDGVLYMESIPDGRPFRKTYKVRDGQLVYDPAPDEEEAAGE